MKTDKPTKKELKMFIRIDRMDIANDGVLGYISLWHFYQEHPEMFCGIEAEYFSKETDPREFNYIIELRKFYKKNKHLWNPL